MAEETVVEGQTQAPLAADPQVEAEARRSGWRPKDQFQGDPSDWVDATTFVKRGREIASHMRANNTRLEQENATLKAAQAAQAAELEETKQQVKALTEFRTEMANKDHVRTLAQLKQDLKDARAAGDIDREVEIQTQIAGLRPPARPAPSGDSRPAPAAAPARAEIPQELREWTAANPWYAQDPVMQQAMNVVGAELRSSGKFHVGMSLTEQLNATAKVVQERYMPAPSHGAPRVEGSRPSGEGSGSRPPSNEPSYETLPANIKVECDAVVKRLGIKIGPNSQFKTQDDWRKHYARMYFSTPDGYDYRPPGN